MKSIYLLLLFWMYTVAQGCKMMDSCEKCTKLCYWIRIGTDHFCVSESLSEASNILMIAPGETERCVGFNAVGTRPRGENFYSPKSANKTKKAPESSRTSIPGHVKLTHLEIIIFIIVVVASALGSIIWIVKLKRRRRLLEQRYPCVRFKDDEVIINLNLETTYV